MGVVEREAAMIEGFFDLDNVLAQVNDKVAFPRILNEMTD